MSTKGVVAIATSLALAGVSAAAAADGIAPPPEKKCDFACDLGRDFRAFATSRRTVVVLATGLGASLLTTTADDRVLNSRINSELFPHTALDRVLEPGEVGGGAAVQVGAALATFAVGKVARNGPVASVGSALLRAQILNGVVTTTLKLSVRRERPDGSDRRSFPSGHTSASFATATVLQRQLGWKAGVPAFALAGLIGASRLSESRHHLSDVAFGAAVGIAAGMSVGLEGRDSALQLRPQLVPGGLGLEFAIGVR